MKNVDKSQKKVDQKNTSLFTQNELDALANAIKKLKVTNDNPPMGPGCAGGCAYHR